MNSTPQYGRDRRRRLSKTEALQLYEQAGGVCQRCGEELGADWHQSHLIAHTNGGVSNLENMQAWCADCNLRLGAQDVRVVDDVPLRTWQKDAVPVLLKAMNRNGFATLNAAMGAGKTREAAVLFRWLKSLGIVDRLLYCVPNVNLVDQTVDEFADYGVHLDSNARDGVIEHPDTVGAVVTYQSLPNSAGSHATRMDQVSTLVIFDEVHHIADKASWGTAVRTMVGDVASGQLAHATCLLNMTGTLFRSSSDKRIATVRYQRVIDEDGAEKYQAIADYTITLAELAGRELRSPDVYRYSLGAKIMDLSSEDVVEGNIADLDKQQRSCAIREGFARDEWLRGFCKEALLLLERSLYAIQHREPLKILYVAHSQPAARKAADMFDELTGQEFSRLVISDKRGSRKLLKKARKENRSCAIVTVDMVTEGFDCPHVAVEAYASNVTASLYVTQTATRTMRVTTTERKDGSLLPAAILIPDWPEIREAFASVLASVLHTVADEDEDECGKCAHTKHLPAACAECPCIPGPPPPPPVTRYQLLSLDDPLLHSAKVLSQEDEPELLNDEVDHYLSECATIGVPEIWAPRVGIISRRTHSAAPTYTPPHEREETTVVKTPANPRDVVQTYRSKLDRAASWMHHHVSHDNRYVNIGMFQNMANDAGHIPKGGRDQARPEQLKVAGQWMNARIREHCSNYFEPMPEWAKEESQ